MWAKHKKEIKKKTFLKKQSNSHFKHLSLIAVAIGHDQTFGFLTLPQQSCPYILAQMKWCIFVKCLAKCLAHSRYSEVFVNNTTVGIPVLLHNEKMEERTSNPSWYVLLMEVPFFLVCVFNCFIV